MPCYKPLSCPFFILELVSLDKNLRVVMECFFLIFRFILGAVSPAVVVPSMLSLQIAGYGTREGIPTLVMAASSCDDVLAISLFSVFLGIAFSQGRSCILLFINSCEICFASVDYLYVLCAFSVAWIECISHEC